MIYQYQCRLCLREFEEYNSIGERDKAFCCGVIAQRLISTPQIMSEEKYQHTSYSFSKPTWVHGRKHYNELLKQNGLVKLTNEELKTVKRDKDPVKQKRKSIVKKMVNRMRQDGVLHAVPSFFKDVVKVKGG